MEIKSLIYIIFTVCALILLLVGFSIGYFYKYDENKSCMNNPLNYGIKEVNNLSGDYFMCQCYSSGEARFYFDEEGVTVQG